MTLLPIVQRELEVSARRALTYWTRVVAGALVLVIAGGILLVAQLQQGRLFGQPGPILFGALRWLSFLVAAAAGVFLTSDCLSEEKREGTLGLLFLTDLRGHDVVLGKLLGTSLRAVYGLAAAFPIFGLAFLQGGVTGQEVARFVLVLGNALFFSLSAGLLVSSLNRDMLKAVSGTVALNGFFFLILPVLDAAQGAITSLPLALASPSYGMIETAGLRSRRWLTSLVLTHALGWSFLALASWQARRAWQHEPAKPRPMPVARPPARSIHSRPARLEGNPVAWLAGRERWLGGAIRLLIGSGTGLFLVLLGLGFREGAGLAGLAIFRVMSLLFGLWLAVQASRFPVEARRAGWLELLLATPLSGAEIARGQWQALRNLFLPPALVLLALWVVASALQWTGVSALAMPNGVQLLVAQVLQQSFGLVQFLTGLWALAWFGLWMGLTSRTAGVAVLKTILFVKVLPWLALTFAQGIVTVLMFTAVGTAGQWALWVSSSFAGIFAIALDLGFIIVSRRQVLANFRHYAAEPGHSLISIRPPPLPASNLDGRTANRP